MPHPHPSRTQQIAAELRDEILRGGYRPGDRLPSERDLSQRFDVHRGAVREALKKLEQLGVAVILPGGARVAPLDDASLDVVEHLLDLRDPPDPELVDQVLELLGGLMSTAARLGVQRGSEAQLARAREIAAGLAEPVEQRDDYLAKLDELGQLFLDLSHNFVLRLARNGIRHRIIDPLKRRDLDAIPPTSMLQEVALQLDRAIESRDPGAASEAMYQLISLNRESVVKALRAQLAVPASGGERS
jgi:DNA-binding FadR family transcriptional regulator